MANTKKNVGLFGEFEFHQIGPFPFVKEGCLLIKELNWFDKQNTRKMSSVKSFLELAAKIAKSENIDEKSAVAIVQNLQDEENQIYALKYIDELGVLQDAQYTELDSKADLCKMMLNSRVEKAFFIEHKDALASRYGMQIDDSVCVVDLGERFPESVIDDIVWFTYNEKDKWSNAEPDNEDVPPTLGE